MNFADRAHGNTRRARFCFSRMRASVRRWFWQPANRIPLIRAVSSLIILLSSFLLTGCFRHEPPANVTIINGNEPESLDPHIVTGVSEMRLTKALFDGLTKLEPTNATPVPALAERWEISPDGTVYKIGRAHV